MQKYTHIKCYLEAAIPQLPAQRHTMLEHMFLRSRNEHLRLSGAQLLLGPRLLRLDDGEDALDADTDADARHLAALGVEHAHQVVVAPTARHAAHARRLARRRLLIRVS